MTTDLQVATKADLEMLGIKLDGRISLVLWMAGFNLTLTLGVLAKMMFFTGQG